MGRMGRVLGPAVCVLGVAQPAAAFQIESNFSDGCHEAITLQAFRDSGWPDLGPPALTEEERLIIRDLPFSFPDDLHDPWALAIVIGARDNDLRGHAVDDLAANYQIHNDPEGQDAHCLRAQDHDSLGDNDGDLAALADCRDFILDEVRLALAENGQELPDRPDVVSHGCETFLDATERVPVTLVFRGYYEATLQRFFFHMGRALHAIEDSFTHTFRDDPEEPEDGRRRRVRHVLNWIDMATRPDYDEARDGHEHMNRLDICDDATEPRRQRRRLATDAATRMLVAMADDSGGVEGRLVRAREVLDEFLEFDDPDVYEEYGEAGCQLDNDWCDATELHEPAGCSCSAAPGASGASWALLLALAGLVAIRRRVLTALLAVGLAPAIAAAAEGPAESPPAASASVDDACHCVGGYLGGGVSAHFWGAAAVGGLRYAASDTTTLGIDAEWNPWYSFIANQVAPGVASLYATMIFNLVRYPIRLAGRERHVALRTTVHAGTTMLLFDLPAAPAYTFGGYVGWALLGVSVPLRGRLALVVNPAHVAIPTPALFGTPFFYIQYRTTVGLEWMP